MLGFDPQTLERRTLARNEVLFKQGDTITAIYFLETGRLKSFAQHPPALFNFLGPCQSDDQLEEQWLMSAVCQRVRGTPRFK